MWSAFDVRKIFFLKNGNQLHNLFSDGANGGIHGGFPSGKELSSFLVLLGVPKLTFFPHAVHAASVAEGVTLLIVVQVTFHLL